MSQQWQGFRSVAQEAVVSDQYNAALAKWPRLDEAWRGLEWLLARAAPESGRARQEAGELFRVYKQEGDFLAKTPSILIVFTFDNECVTIHDVRFSEPPTPF